MNLKRINDVTKKLSGQLTPGNLNDYSNLKIKICPTSEELFEPIQEELDKLPSDSVFEYIISNAPSKSAYKSLQVKNIYVNLFKH